ICAGFKGRPLISYQLRIPDRGWLSAVTRKLPLEQFPQLWNVLIGRMSMVGPRPERAEIAAELTRMIPVYECRQNVKPGITGWAQLHARKDEPVRDTLKEFEYDLYYVKNHAPSLYAFILLNGI